MANTRAASGRQCACGSQGCVLLAQHQLFAAPLITRCWLTADHVMMLTVVNAQYLCVCHTPFYLSKHFNYVNSFSLHNVPMGRHYLPIWQRKRLKLRVAKHLPQILHRIIREKLGSDYRLQSSPLTPLPRSSSLAARLVVKSRMSSNAIYVSTAQIS